MSKIIQKKIQNGLGWIEIPEADLRILCGAPADSIKHLAQHGCLQAEILDGGYYYEKGPNVILLSDRLFQNGKVSNLSEFPILHMLYKQGILIPEHPNNTLPKPILIGHPNQVRQQLDYLFYGSYGVVDPKAYQAAGVSAQSVKKHLSYKKRFAFGTFHEFSDLVETKDLSYEPVELRNKVMIHRKGSNLFQVSYDGEYALVDLGLRDSEEYIASYKLPEVEIKKAYFSIIHIGEGDGWDEARPCLGSLVQFNGKHYSVDAGPNIETSLNAVGLNALKLEGVFLTHVHDDHFAGIPFLLSENPNLKIYASNRVYITFLYKYAALLGINIHEAKAKVKWEPLPEEEWCDVGGLSVYSFPSPHPIDTNIFVFQAEGKDGIKNYGHFADITALAWLEKMIVKKGDNTHGISQTFYKQIKKFYAQKLTVKKVDVGGLPIHGSEVDFINDPSERLILAHTSKPLNAKQLAIGEQAQFGEQEILILEKP